MDSQELDNTVKKRFIKKIVRDHYSIEVTDNVLFARINIPRLEKLIESMDPFAYILVSKRGLILERLSDDLIADTEFNKLNQLLSSMEQLTRIVAEKG